MRKRSYPSYDSHNAVVPATVRRRIPQAIAALVLAAACLPAAAQVAEIEVATVPGGIRVPFQSHNQKVVRNDYGIFATRGDRQSSPGHFWLRPAAPTAA